MSVSPRLQRDTWSDLLKWSGKTVQRAKMYPTLKIAELAKSRSFSDNVKATVALEALRGDKTAQEIAAKHKVHPTQVTTWKRQAIDGLTGVFSDKVRRIEDDGAEVKELHAKI